ncbi:MAG: DUF790 family protein [Candidatus Jordarchaeales archaeon]|nr:DUF790 family protein [Candidatus Bathyarchaeota archaeon]
MLPSDLLIVTRWRDNIRPKYSRLGDADVSLASEVIQIYRRGVGLKRGEVRERVLELEEACGRYKFVRGLALLVERRCDFTLEAAVNPLEARHTLFALAASRGHPTTEEERRNLLDEAARMLGVSAEQLESSLYADLDSEAVLKAAPDVDAFELLKEYNLSQTQTLLFFATEISFSASGNWQRIFRAIKYHGLMYSMMRNGDLFTVKLEGPVSLLKLTRRYGAAIAKVFPEIVRGRPWRVEAKILKGNRILNFFIDSVRFGGLFPDAAPQEAFDSQVEEDFLRQFKALGTNWNVRREAEPVEAGSSVLIPDFVFTLGKTRVFMEVVGFWTRDYLRRKLEKLSEVKGSPFIVAVNEELACDKIARLQNPGIHLIYYRGRIPVKAVLDALAPYARSELDSQAAGLRITVEDSIVPLERLAEKHGVTVEAVKRAAANVESHVLIGDVLVDKRLISQVREVLKSNVGDGAPLTRVLDAISQFNLPDPIAAITYCGFQVVWHDLLPENAIVKPSP